MFFGFGYFGESQKEQAFRLQAEEQGGGTRARKGKSRVSATTAMTTKKGRTARKMTLNKKTAARRFFYARRDQRSLSSASSSTACACARISATGEVSPARAAGISSGVRRQ